MGRVLVTDSGSRNTVAAVRSLGRAGLEVVTAEVTRVAMGRFSRFVTRHLVYPSPSIQPDLWVEWLFKEMSTGEYDLVLPMDDDTVRLCAEHKRDLSKLTNVPVPDYPALLNAREKAATIKLAEEIGLPVPRTVFPSDGYKASKLASEMNFPVVVKPRLSSGSRGIKYVDQPRDLKSAFEAVHERYPFPIVQERIPPGGDACGVFALFGVDHRAVATFCHRRLRSYPVKGGPSTLRESIWAPELIAQGVRLLEKLNWYGVAMVEFLQDPKDGIYKLMEINPRFWGSLQLSVSAGIDFPFLLYQVATGRKFSPPTRYKVGIRCRWLLPGDILHFLFNPDRFRMNPGFFHYDARTSDDFISLRDPGPTIGFFLMLFRYVLSWSRWEYVFKR